MDAYGRFLGRIEIEDGVDSEGDFAFVIGLPRSGQHCLDGVTNVTVVAFERSGYPDWQ